MKASRIFDGCRVSDYPRDLDIHSIVSDSRRVAEGDLFVCLRGIHRDGHDYAKDAIANGAALVLAERPIADVPPEKIIFTADTRVAESMLWYNFTGRPTDAMTKIAVTGTAGKTTVACVLAHILRADGRRVGLITTVCVLSGEKTLFMGESGGSSVLDIAGAMTTPDPEYFFGACAAMQKDGCDVLVYEASSQALLLHKLDPLMNDAAIFTNLSAEHLDCHGTMESYFAVKASMMLHTKLAVVNMDDCWMRRLGALYPQVSVVNCSADPAKVAGVDVCALRYKPHGVDGIEYVYFSEKAVFRVRTPLMGRYSVINTLEAAACAVSLGVNLMTVKEALEDFSGVEGRMQRVRCPGDEEESLPQVYIDYAHTPGAMESVLKAFRENTQQRLVVLFGCGGDRDEAKRPRMAEVAQQYADYVIITSDNPRTEEPGVILANILSGVDRTKPYTVIPNRRDAIRFAVESFGRGDLILLAGKGHEKYEITKNGMHPFDEAAIVRDAMRQKLMQSEL